MRLFNLLFIIPLFFIASCSKHTKRAEQVLKQAGENRSELETVLDYYNQKPSDSLKYKAACFLIENMAYHYSYDTTPLYKYRPVIERIRDLRIFGVSNELIKKQVNPIMDSLISIYPLSQVYNYHQKILVL